LIALQLSSCATTALWRRTDPSSYVVISSADISEAELQKRGVKYIKDEQAAVFYVEKTDFEKFSDYTFRALGTPLTVVIDTAIVVLVAYAFLQSGSGMTARTGDERRLNNNIARLNKIGSVPQGEKSVIDVLSRTFPVTPEKIGMLRDRNLKYGDIAAILAFSQTMTGGVVDANIDRIIDIRKIETDWGGIAAFLHVPAKDISTRVYTICGQAKKEMKKSSALPDNSTDSANSASDMDTSPTETF